MDRPSDRPVLSITTMVVQLELLDIRPQNAIPVLGLTQQLLACSC